MLVNMGRIFKQTTLRFPDRPALINIERHRSFTYRQMHLLSNRVCHLLKGKFGLSQGNSYVTLLENDNMGLFHPWMLKSEVTAVWLNVKESLPVKLEQIDHVQPRLVFIEADYLEELDQDFRARDMAVVVMDPVKSVREGVYSFWDLIEQASDAEVEQQFAADDAREHTSIMRFTGGTTGRPKCAMYSLNNFWVWGCNPAHYYETVPFPHPRAMFFSPINHAASGSVIIPVHIKGGAVITLNLADLELIGRSIEREKADLIYAVPTVLYRMLADRLPSKYDLGSLKTIRYGGASISPAKLEDLLKDFGRIFVQGYGSTECWPSATVLSKQDHAADTEQQIQRLASIGRPLPGEELFIGDDQGRELAAGRQGEILIRGINTIQGYYRDPEATGQNFTESGFWKSGDIGFMDEDGFVYLVDRKKDMIITGGYNVYAQEVENRLNSHPAVENSAVVGLPDDLWGEAVTGVVVLKEDKTVAAQELIRFCRQGLAGYKSPKHIEIVKELPLSPAGKVLRREVRKKLLAGIMTEPVG